MAGRNHRGWQGADVSRHSARRQGVDAQDWLDVGGVSQLGDSAVGLRRRHAPSSHSCRYSHPVRNGHSLACCDRGGIADACYVRANATRAGQRNAADGHSDAGSRADCYAHFHTGNNANRDGCAYSYANANGYTGPVTHSRADCYARAYSYSRAEGNPGSNGHSSANRNANADTRDADTHSAAAPRHVGYALVEEQPPCPVSPDSRTALDWRRCY